MMQEEGVSNMTKRRQSGSIMVFIMAAIFLMGLLIAAMTQGSKKSASSVQLDTMMVYFQTDLKTIQGDVVECVRTYPDAVDVDASGTINATDNPNAPFPLYGTNAADTLANLASGGVNTEATSDAGVAIPGTAAANLRCPGAPDGQRVILGAASKFKVLGDSAYSVRYFSNTTEGAYVRITRLAADDLWTEAISRLNGKFSTCAAAAVTAAGTCANGCFYYWVLRRPTSTLGGEAGCP